MFFESVCMFFFFKQKTAYEMRISDWSSDVCSSDLAEGRPVIEELSLTLTGPERVAIAGPNGSGKSTLLALVAGTLAPWSGEVRVGVPLDRKSTRLNSSH